MVDLNESGLAQDWQATGRMNATEALMGMIFLTIALFDGRLTGRFYAWLSQASISPNSSGYSVCRLAKVMRCWKLSAQSVYGRVSSSLESQL